jgi:hypothetical protein
MNFVIVVAVVSAVGLAAFKNPSDGWIQSLIFAPVIALASTVLGVILFSASWSPPLFNRVGCRRWNERLVALFEAGTKAGKPFNPTLS